MSLLDRYVARELAKPFLTGFAFCLLALVSGEYLLKLTAYAARGAPFLPITELFTLRLVTQSVIALPGAALLAVLIGMARLSGDSEIVALQAGGISFARIARAPILFGLSVSLLALALGEFAVPGAARLSAQIDAAILTGIGNELVASVGVGKAYVIQDFDGRRLSRLGIARDFDARTGKMKGVMCLQFSEGRLQAVVEAKEAEWIRRQQWRFQEPRIIGVGSIAADRQVRIEGASDATLTAPDREARGLFKEGPKAAEMSYRELRDHIARLRAEHAPRRAVQRLQVHLYEKFSLPFASLAFAILAAPLGIRRQRSTTAAGFGMGVGFMFLYYLTTHFMTVLAEGGDVPPLLASWTANGLAVLAGLLLIRRASR